MTSANVLNVPVAPNVNNAANVKSTKDNKNADFMNLMSQTVGQTKQSAPSTTQFEDNKKSVSDVAAKQSYDMNNSKTDCKIKQSDSTVDDEKMDQVEDALDEFESNVRKTLEEELLVSQDDINEAMEILGFNFIDLTNPQNMTKLVAQISDCDNTISFITSNAFANVLGKVSDFAAELLDQTQMSLAQLTELVSKQMETMSGLDVTSEAMPDFFETMQQLGTAETNVATANDTITENELTTATLTEDGKKTASVEVAIEKTDGTEMKDGSTIEKTVNESSKQMEGELQQQNEGGKENTPGHEAEPETKVLHHQNAFHASVEPQINAPFSVEQQVPQQTQAVDLESLMNQVVEAAKVSVGKGETSMEMILNPESLGKLYMQVAEKEGNVSAKFVVQTEEAKAALESQMIQLKENLNQQGVKVDSIEVTIGTHEFEENLEQNAKKEEQQAEEMERATKQNRTRNINLNDLDDMQGLMTKEEELVAQMMKDQGNTVNYTA